MVTLCVSVGTHSSASSLQQPAQRVRTTQDGMYVCSISSGYSWMMSTSTSRVLHVLFLYTSMKGITEEDEKSECSVIIISNNFRVIHGNTFSLYWPYSSTIRASYISDLWLILLIRDLAFPSEKAMWHMLRHMCPPHSTLICATSFAGFPSLYMTLVSHDLQAARENCDLRQHGARLHCRHLTSIRSPPGMSGPGPHVEPPMNLYQEA